MFNGMPLAAAMACLPWEHAGEQVCRQPTRSRTPVSDAVVTKSEGFIAEGAEDFSASPR